METVRRSHITLLEILTAIALIALFAGIIGVNINKALVEQRFRNEVGLILDDLRLAQDLMFILGTDVYVKFEEAKDGDGIRFWIEQESVLLDSVRNEIARKSHVLKTIRGVFFRDETTDERSKGKVDMKFLSKGAVMSKGIMRVATSDSESPPPNVLQCFICLAGYPHPIISQDTKEAAENEYKKSVNQWFNKQVTQDTFSKIPDKLKQTSDPLPKS